LWRKIGLKLTVVIKPIPPALSRLDRRRGADRRKEDKGPPKGMRDRRVHVEARKPEVQEVDISASDWASLTDLPPPPPKPPKVPS
jgi:hypothetical protein